MKLLQVSALAVVVALAATGAQAFATKERGIHDTYTALDAQKAQAFVTAAMTTPMADLLHRADVTDPQAMLEYGLALELGRPTATDTLSRAQKDKLKADYRLMLDQYLTSGDKKDPVLADANFENDAMLDNQEFWVDLAKQIGRRKERLQIDQTVQADSFGGQGGSMMTFIPDPQDEDNKLNLSHDLVLDRAQVNAATGCAESAAGFAKMKKAQTIDITATKLAPDQFTNMKAQAARIYRTSYAVGVMACGGRDYFFKTADFAGQNLGAYGTLKDDPNAVVASVGDSGTEPAAKN